MTDPDAGATEVELVRRAAAGDRQAFARLYDANADRVYRYLMARAGDTTAAEDLTSEVFLRAWTHIGHYRIGATPFIAWLYRLARNLWIDHVRRRPEVPLDELRRGPSAGPMPESEAERRWQAERVRRALSHLTEEQHCVLSLRFYGGLTTRQIAAALGKSEGSIRALQLRALRALARRLEESHV